MDILKYTKTPIIIICFAVIFQEEMTAKGHFQTKRRQQQRAWMWNYIQDNVMQMFTNDNDVKEHVKRYEKMVQSEEMTPSLAANELLQIFADKRKR